MGFQLPTINQLVSFPDLWLPSSQYVNLHLEWFSLHLGGLVVGLYAARIGIQDLFCSFRHQQKTPSNHWLRVKDNVTYYFNIPSGKLTSPMFNRKYIFISGSFSIAMLVWPVGSLPRKKIASKSIDSDHTPPKNCFHPIEGVGTLL